MIYILLYYISILCTLTEDLETNFYKFAFYYKYITITLKMQKLNKILSQSPYLYM